MLDMLCKLLHQEGVASKLCSLGMISALEVLRDTGSPQVRRSSDRTLTALIQASLTLAHQPVSSDESSQHVPSSRCQSNSPGLPDSLPKQHLLHKLGTSQGRTKHGRISRSRDSLEHVSHAFGSQQGVDCHEHSSRISLYQALCTTTLLLHDTCRHLTVLLPEPIYCAEIPSFGGQQHTSPKTAGSQIAAGNEAAARVSCRAQWRRQAQTTSTQPPEPQEHTWTLRAITIGKYLGCSSWTRVQQVDPLLYLFCNATVQGCCTGSQ